MKYKTFSQPMLAGSCYHTCSIMLYSPVDVAAVTRGKKIAARHAMLSNLEGKNNHVDIQSQNCHTAPTYQDIWTLEWRHMSVIASWSMVDRLLLHQLVRTGNKESIISWPFVKGNPLVTSGFTSQKVSDTERIPCYDVVMEQSMSVKSRVLVLMVHQ